MTLKRIIPLFIIVSLTSCNHRNDATTNESTNYEDSVLQSKGYLDDYKKLPSSCSEILINKIEGLYTRDEKDSISNIYSISGRLYPDHYSKRESDLIEKFSFFIYRSDTIENIHFGVRQRTSDIIFLNELELTDLKTVIAKEEHVVFSANLTQVEKLGCVDLDMEEGLSNEVETHRSISTFENNENYLWVVDSIQENQGTKSLFSEIDTFRVVDNKYIISTDKKLEFFFANYSMNLIDSTDTVVGRFISYADNYRILLEEQEDSHPWIYLKRLK
ncbi:MAG: hypothetical protein ACQERC_11490 [Bacteroidota bacterium]